jgi:hypothetical protein
MGRFEQLTVGELTVGTINGYLADTLGLGPGLGDIWYVAPTDASTARYRSKLISNGVAGDHLFSTLAAAENAAIASRNDVVCVLPGSYTVTASLTWDKNQTHLVGLGGPNQFYCPTTATNGAVKLYCATSAVDNILAIAGNYNQIHGIQTQNTYNGTSNVCDVKVQARNTFIKNCHFRGGNGAGQLGANAGIPLYIDSSVAGGGNGFRAENCTFGTSGNSARTSGPGAVYFVGGAAAAFNPVFKNCTFEMRCETTGSSNPKLIHLAANYAVDRMLLFDDCIFYSFWENMGGNVDYAIVDACTTTHSIVLKNCAMAGIDAWCNVSTYCFATIANAGSDGGKATAVDTTP